MDYVIVECSLIPNNLKPIGKKEKKPNMKLSYFPDWKTWWHMIIKDLFMTLNNRETFSDI